MRETSEERAHILNRMRAASNAFYAAAAHAGCHAFIEFTGLMNEFIKLCEDAEQQGTDWVHANVHGDVHLPFKPYHVEYLSEKLECIYGRRLQLADDLIEPLAFAEIVDDLAKPGKVIPQIAAAFREKKERP